jgi:hypothetical protein
MRSFDVTDAACRGGPAVARFSRAAAIVTARFAISWQRTSTAMFADCQAQALIAGL